MEEFKDINPIIDDIIPKIEIGAKIKNNVLISVIIPVYNVEKYLEKALRSITSQDFLDIEILCIDDCSTDASLSLLTEFAKTDKRIKIFQNLKNSGVGFSRNVGLDNAAGDFIMFLDSDDFVETDFCGKMYNAITTPYPLTTIQPDLAICDASNVFDTDFTSTKREVKKDRNYATITSHMIWNKIFRRSLIENANLRFPTDVKGGEDVFFTICYKALCKNNIVTINEKLYNYLIRNGSLMSATDLKDNEKMLDSFTVSDHIYDFFKNNKMLDEVYDIYFQNLRFAITNFTKKNYDRISAIILKSLKTKPEIEIYKNCFKVKGKEYKVNDAIFEKVKKLYICNKQQEGIKSLWK